MAENAPTNLVSKAASTSASKKDKGRNKARIKVFMPIRVRKRDVAVTYPKNKEEHLVVKVHDVIYFDEPLPDVILRADCKVYVKNQDGKSRIKLVLAKKHEALWEENWCIE